MVLARYYIETDHNWPLTFRDIIQFQNMFFCSHTQLRWQRLAGTYSWVTWASLVRVNIYQLHQFNLPLDHIYLPFQLAKSKLDDDDTTVTRQDQGDFWPWILAPDWRYGRQIWSSCNIPYLVLFMNPIFIYWDQIIVFQATIDNGFVTIRGRIKDVIITSGGKNIAPDNVN